MRLQLSPAELDKQLLEFYKSVVDGPSGDILRVIGGGQDVALQDLYIKNNSLRKRSEISHSPGKVRFGASEDPDKGSDEEERTASQWVNFILRRNLPKVDDRESHRGSRDDKNDKSKEMNMTLRTNNARKQFHLKAPCPALFKDSFCVGRSRVSSSFSLLI